MKHFHLLPDLQKQLLINANTYETVAGTNKAVINLQIALVDPKMKYAQLLSKFPTVIGADKPRLIKKRGVFHYIKTTAPPCAQRARRLPPEKLKIAKAEFEKWCKLGIC
ncbi:hypothetical protein, partial [Escherichia coli]|uniref:hypothetical protein n=1 Tax=Escherichia coli TaxID=562 RepID=UPI002916A5E2